MSEVTVRASAHVLGLIPDEEVTVEETETVKTHIAAGLLTVVGRGPATEVVSGPSYPPGEHTVDEVNDYLADADPLEVARVLAAEEQGKNRAGIVEGPHADGD